MNERQAAAEFSVERRLLDSPSPTKEAGAADRYERALMQERKDTTVHSSMARVAVSMSPAGETASERCGWPMRCHLVQRRKSSDCVTSFQCWFDSF